MHTSLTLISNQIHASQNVNYTFDCHFSLMVTNWCGSCALWSAAEISPDALTDANSLLAPLLACLPCSPVVLQIAGLCIGRCSVELCGFSDRSRQLC